ncbi:glycosyltransferase involved in cell wall biosynthesis [Providencia alcalifaciens]|nr:glycosyltransferase involved in cell wall biosynthesis [Providencia alcalifaciens]
MSFHSSAIAFFSLIILFLLYKYHFRYYFITFLLSIPFYILVAKYTPFILENIGLRFSSYIDSDYFKQGDYITIITKIYYLPVLLLFFYLYNKRKTTESIQNYFSFTILIFSCTYWLFLMSLDIAILSRVSNYFWFFIIFSLYYVGVYFSTRGVTILSLYLLYIFAPYCAKVTFLAKNEFIYRSIIFN